MIKYILTCNPNELNNFIPNHNNEYVFYKGLYKGQLLCVNLKTKEIEFSHIELLHLLKGNYKEVIQ